MNKEEKKIKAREYYLSHLDEIMIRKERYAEKQKAEYICECGKKMNYHSKYNHVNSKGHKQIMEKKALEAQSQNQNLK